MESEQVQVTLKEHANIIQRTSQDIDLSQLDKLFEYIEEEIEIRFESIYEALNQEKESLIGQVESYFGKLKENMNKLDNSKNKKKSNDIHFRSFEKKIRKCKRLTGLLKKNIEIRQGNLIRKIRIGRIKHRDNIEIILKQNKISQIGKDIRLSGSPAEICVLPTNYLAVLFPLKNNITLLDENFKVAKVINQIDNQSIESYGITTNDKDRVYVTGFHSNKVYMTDCDFNLNKAYAIQFKAFPQGICYSNNHVYVCYCDPHQIVKFSESLELISTFPLTFTPFRIRILGNTACVDKWTDRHTHYYSEAVGQNFYDLETFNLKNQFQHEPSRASCSVVDSMFCVINSRFITFFDENGKEKSHQNAFLNYRDSCDGCIVIFNNQYVMSVYSQGKLVVF